MASTYDRLANPKFQAFDSDGVPLSGGLLYTYAATTTTNKTTYSTPAGTANANPVVLDSRGEADVYGSGFYKFVLKTSAGVTVWTLDNVHLSTDVGLALIDDTTVGAQLTTLGISAFAQTLLDDTTASAVMTTLGFSTLGKSLIDDTTMGAFLTSLGISAPVQTFLDDATIQAARVTLQADATYTNTGAADAYVITPSPAISAYVTGMRFCVYITGGANNTGACTLNVNALGATAIKLMDGTNPVANQLINGQICMFIYDGASFQLLNPIEPHNFVTVAYTGDAAATKAITGVGFRPTLVMIYEKATAYGLVGCAIKSNQDGTKTLLSRRTANPSTVGTYYSDDDIISLDADGFTVGDGTVNTFNSVNAATNYVALCWK